MTLQGRPGAHLGSAPKGLCRSQLVAPSKSESLVEDRLLRRFTRACDRPLLYSLNEISLAVLCHRPSFPRCAAGNRKGNPITASSARLNTSWFTGYFFRPLRE